MTLCENDYGLDMSQPSIATANTLTSLAMPPYAIKRSYLDLREETMYL